jgi:hypothetical protein
VQFENLPSIRDIFHVVLIGTYMASLVKLVVRPKIGIVSFELQKDHGPKRF